MSKPDHTAERRDEIVKRMLATPPQPRERPSKPTSEPKKGIHKAAKSP